MLVPGELSRKDRTIVDNLELEHRIKRLEERLDEEYLGPVIKDSPVRSYQMVVQDSGNPGYSNRLLIGTPTTGLVRIEWVMGRFGQTIPPNWSMVQVNQYINAFIPLRYQVANAQNLIVKAAIEGNFEWLLLIEHDNVLPPDAFKRWNKYMLERKVPVVSGLYYTRSRPSEPLIYRGRGTGSFVDWEFGDLVWCDGVPTGSLLIHMGILRKMWEESEPYIIKHPNGNQDSVRKVFNTPGETWLDPETNQFNAMSGTSDLAWCTRVMEGNYFTKAGWDEYQEMEYPFLVDTNIFVRHINPDGEQFP